LNPILFCLCQGLNPAQVGDHFHPFQLWVQSLKTRANATEPSALDLTNIITSENTDIPIIETDENDHPLGWV
jgi:hypothetical protein